MDIFELDRILEDWSHREIVKFRVRNPSHHQVTSCREQNTAIHDMVKQEFMFEDPSIEMEVDIGAVLRLDP